MTIQRLSSRVGSIAESATLAVTNKARELRAAGEPDGPVATGVLGKAAV